MCEGKISKRSWREFKEQMENEMNDEDWW
jgi:hypothetical protein